MIPVSIPDFPDFSKTVYENNTIQDWGCDPLLPVCHVIKCDAQRDLGLSLTSLPL